MLDPVLELIGINLEHIVDLSNATRCECLLVDVDVAIVRASIRSINIEIH